MPDQSGAGRRRNEITEEDGPGEWLITYADLMTLLLVFFVMLFSISNLDVLKFRDILASVRKSFGLPTALIEMQHPDSGRNDQEKTMDKEEDYEIPAELMAELDKEFINDVEEMVQRTRIGDNIVVTREKNRMIITVEGQVLFDSGQAELRPEAAPILDEIAVLIKKHPNYRVNIKGHTDDNPISTPRFPSNWELSAVRATTVLRFLLEEGVNPQRLTATGYGELLPVAPNDTPENMAKNRRVEFVLEKESAE